METSALRTFVRKYSVFIVLILILAVIGVGYAIGYRVYPGGIARIGTLTLTNLPTGTTVYADQRLLATAKTQGDVSLELVPGNHAIIIGAPNSYPWSSVVGITSGADTRINPFLLATKVAVTALTGTDEANAIQAIGTSTIPTEQHPLAVSNGCASVYVSNNQLIEAATSTPGCVIPKYLCLSGTCEPTIIFSPVAPITNVFIFPQRQDALAISFAGALYAISLDPTSPQFFAPLVRGAAPRFGQMTDGTIVVQEGTTVSKLGF